MARPVTALEIAGEERASYRDPEVRDGDLPQLESSERATDGSQTDR